MPETKAPLTREQASLKIMVFLVESESLEGFLRLAEEAIATVGIEMAKLQNGHDVHGGAKHLRISEQIEQVINNNYGL
jgi:hypothetical protein